MSASAEASQPTRRPANPMTLFPPEVWTNIFRHLDIESLLSVAEAAPELKRFAFTPTVLQRVTVAQETDERTIRQYQQTTRQEFDTSNQIREVPLTVHAHELHFTNCLALPSEVILGCAALCENLRELCCVNCVVEPGELFVLLSTRLKSVRNLEWSLHDEKYYKSRLNAAGHITGFKSEGPRIDTMYIEVAVTDTTEGLMFRLLHRCGDLRHLHVHAVRKGQSELRPLSSARAPHMTGYFLPDLKTFKCTSEQQLSLKEESRIHRRHEMPCKFSPQILITADVAVHLTPKYGNGIRTLADVLKQDNSLQGAEQTTLPFYAYSKDVSLELQATAYAEHWNYIERLNLAREANTKFPPIAPSGDLDPMRQFFETSVARLTELNLTAFHFAVDCNACDVVASALPKLRALALTPCGANRDGSLESLADGCASLEILDVRASACPCLASSCAACQLPLRFTRRGVASLHQTTRLRRLSIDETAKIANLAFLIDCRVEELRLSLDSAEDKDLAQCPTSLCLLLSANPRLSSLTLLARKVTLSHRFAVDLSGMQNLEHLCVLTVAPHRYAMAKDFFADLEVRLPRLRSAHVHFMSVCNNVHRSTWVRQRRPDIGSELGEGASRTAHGVRLDDHPCLGRLCCVDTFIGLVWPRNRS